MTFFESWGPLVVFVIGLGSSGIAAALGGVATHHGVITLPAVIAASVGAVVVKRLVTARFTRLEVLRGRGPRLWSALGWTVLCALLGYAIAHWLTELPKWGRTAFGLLSAAGVVVLGARIVELMRGGRWAAAPPIIREPWRPVTAALAAVAVIAPLWSPPAPSTDQVVSRALAQHELEPVDGSLRWIDEPYTGFRTASTTARALVLAASPQSPPDAYLIRVALSHEGHAMRVTGIYNLTETAAVAESQLTVWGKWATWCIEHDDRVLSIELADFRGEPPAVGADWTRLARTQLAITNWQERGQLRGIGRQTVTFAEPKRAVSLAIESGRLQATVDGAPLTLELGRPELSQGGSLGELTTQAPARPGNLTTWAVDRLRAVSWIGSDGMQWIKGVVFRAADEIESIEHEVVGIDADEAIAEELGDVLESLPLARSGAIPGWPPAPLEPMWDPVLAGEGRWVRFAEDLVAETGVDTPGPFVFTFIRTDKRRPYAQTSITLWDPRRVALHMVAGTVEPKSTTGAVGTGLIPRDPTTLQALLGAFNGAFQAVHGEFGMMADKRVILPPKPYAATVAELDDGTTGFGTWPADTRIPTWLRSYRQNMTPLVVDDAINPYRRHWWGGVPEGWTEEARTVRSGVCHTRDGFAAYFYAPSIDPDSLAEAMRRTRCDYGIHLDMNAGHTGFELYRVRPAEQLPKPDKPLDPLWEARGTVLLQPGWEFSSRLMVRKMPLMNFPRYIQRTSRDFFYLTRRELLPGPPLEPFAGGLESDGQWRVGGIRDNGWPHAIAVTRLTVPRPEGEPVTVWLSRIDPKQVEWLEAPTASAIASLELPADSGDTKLWLMGASFTITPAPPGSDAREVASGSATAPSKARWAACVDAANTLILAEASGSRGGAFALGEALGRARCTQTMYFDSVVTLTLHEKDGEEKHSDSTGSRTRHLARRIFTGAKRIFEDTPILPPERWAYAQARRVPYTGRQED